MLHAEVLPSGWELAAKDLAARSVIDGFYLMHGVTLG
jgi:hypothetical protein